MIYKKTGEKDEYIILTDEQGNKASYEFLDMSIYESNEYAVLLQKGDDMVTILRFNETENGGEEYFTFDDDRAFNAVYAKFKTEFADEFDFGDSL